MDKIENLKQIHASITNKDAFAETVSNYYGLQKTYVKQHYLQSGWKIPEERIDMIIEIAQKTIRNQIEKLQNALKSA